MSNAKRFLSVVLAIIMVCSTLVIGANAAYTAYKNEGIALTQYNAIDQAVLSTDQYASAAMDEVDRMLNEEQLKFTRDDIVVGDVDLTSLDAAMDSIYAIYKGSLFQTLSGMLGDLKDLNCMAFATEADGGVRRGTPGKTDTDVIYAALQFIHDNANLLTRFVAGNLDLGGIVSSLVDISEFADVNVLLKGLLYEATYVDENGDSLDAPDNVGSLSFDTMVQDLIDRFVIDELEVDDVKIGAAFEGKTNISTGTMYNFLDEALKVCYNVLLVPLLNGDAKKGIREVCGVEYIDNGDGTVTEDTSNLNPYAELLNIDYVIPEYNFTSATLISQLNNVIKSIGDQMVNPDVFVWQGGDNSNFKQNIVNLGKAALVNTGDDFFASYIDVASVEEVEAMSAEELATYALRAIINASVDGMYIPEEATTIREFGYYALTELLATAVPSLDFSGLDKNSTDSLIIMGIDYAIYSINANLDMGLEYVYTMEGVDAQLAQAAAYGIDNYGGLLSGLNLEGVTSGWELLDKILFSIINKNWIPAAYTSGQYVFKDFLIDGLIENILNLDFDALFDLFIYNTTSELNETPKTVVLRRVASILNLIFPGAVSTTATTIDQIGSNAALAATAGAIFDTLWNERVDLVKCILPTLCMILDLTNAQEFEFPELTYDKMVYSSNGIFDFKVNMRNGSTGINTGYTDANNEKHRDTLYTYDIKEITNNLGMTVTPPSRIPGGDDADISITGSVSNESLLKLVIMYDVLTEDGSPLTSTPIEEDVYIVLTKNAPVDGTALTSTAAGGFKIKNGPLNTFAKSVSDITDIELTIENSNASDLDYTAYSDFGSTAAKGQGLAEWVELNDEAHSVIQAVNGNASSGKFEPFKQTELYRSFSGEDKAAAWAAYVDTNKTYNSRTKNWTYPKYTFTLGAQSGSTTTKNTAVSVYLYNDFGLESIVNSELGKHRQASAYSSAEAWADYQAALNVAVQAVYSPFTSTFATGKAANYEKAANGDGTILGLADAIAALEETAQGAGVESLQAIIDQYNPDNQGRGYDDPDYNYFAVADYVDYTYYNYRDEYKAAQKMIDKFNNGEVISELDKTYMEHRLSLYGSRLLPNTPTKIHLAAELSQLSRTAITDPTENLDGWTAESWAGFQRAYAFATAVNTASLDGLKPSKINMAYNELLEAEKRLVKEESDEPIVEEEAFELVDPSETSEEGLFEYEGDETLILSGIGLDGFDPEEYFACTNCYVEVTENEEGNFSTGAVVEIIGETSGEVLATYTIAVYGDINGDLDITAVDTTKLKTAVSGTIDLVDYEIVAADINNDEDYTAQDTLLLKQAVAGSLDLDFVNRAY